jgi:hypothetical protein
MASRVFAHMCAQRLLKWLQGLRSLDISITGNWLVHSAAQQPQCRELRTCQALTCR